MLKEATIYSPVIRTSNGRIFVQFAEGHPGLHDPEYQVHRAAIAKAAMDHRRGQPAPEIAYTEEEHATWRSVAWELREKHERYACAEALEGTARLGLPADRMPQLREVSETVSGLTGFTFGPAAGLVEQREFYGSLADRHFQATQYIRHHSMPRFSPEPDMIHEIVGHGTALAVPRWAAIYELLGRTVRRLRTSEAVSAVSSVFWFTLEYGLVRERGEVRVAGASLLSSCGELEQFRTVRILPLDADAMRTQAYRVEKYQPVLFCADSFGHLEDFLGSFLTKVADEDPRVAV